MRAVLTTGAQFIGIVTPMKDTNVWASDSLMTNYANRMSLFSLSKDGRPILPHDSHSATLTRCRELFGDPQIADSNQRRLVSNHRQTMTPPGENTRLLQHFLEFAMVHSVVRRQSQAIAIEIDRQPRRHPRLVQTLNPVRLKDDSSQPVTELEGDAPIPRQRLQDGCIRRERDIRVQQSAIPSHLHAVPLRSGLSVIGCVQQIVFERRKLAQRRCA